MVRFLPVVVVLMLFAGVLLYLRSQSSLKSPVPEAVTQVTQKIESTSNSSDALKIKTLEESTKLLATEIGKINQTLSMNKDLGALNTTSPMTDTKIKNLETKVADLQAQIDALKSSSSQTSGASTSKSPAYIPLGSSDTANDRNFVSLNTYQVQIDPADYSGYSGMQLEVNLKMAEAVGTANVRLYNSTDSSSVSSSQVSTTATQYTYLTSTKFKLPSGKKTYILQAQSTEGYNVYIQSARLKVSF